MARKRKRSNVREAVGTILLAMAVVTLLSLLSFGHTRNYLGPVGRYLSSGVVGYLGLSSYFVVFAYGALGIGVFRKKMFSWILKTVLSLTLFMVFLNTLFALLYVPDVLFGTGQAGGGSLGLFISRVLIRYTGAVGTYLISLSLLLVSSSILARKPAYILHFWIGKLCWYLIRYVAGVLKNAVRKGEEQRLSEEAGRERERVIRAKEDNIHEPAEGAETDEPPLIIKDRSFLSKEQVELDFEPEPVSTQPRKKVEGYRLPPFSLLDLPQKKDQKERDENIVERTRILEERLNDFGVLGKVRHVMPGPVITTYEFEPGSGVKVSKIVNLSDDLALGMKAVSVRIVAPVPGKAVVGIEIPNRNRESVYLKEILMSPQFQNSNAKLLLGLGKDILGQPVVTDLANIPHLLIAGATGSGKSVALNSMICSILYKSTPRQVKLILIDPKRLELSIYEGIPHLITPVVMDPRKAAIALRWAVDEMERRYTLLSDKGVRNIEGYNSSLARSKKEVVSRNGGEEPLPYVVIVIDELADLMMVSSREVEDALTRLAQMARAAGIHLLVATQRPSVDVITGIIKVNFPARISFQVFSKFDSRTILDTSGAERLLGQGDMLFLRPGTSRLMRIHGPFVSEEEVKRLMEFWKSQQEPEYDESVLQPRGDEDEIGEEEYDEKYEDAVTLVARTGQASISMIQRRLRVGYNRSARMIEMMEREGLVGPADASKPREVYVKESDLRNRGV